MILKTERKKILIVDDVPANINILWEIIKSDYEASVTTNGFDALEIAESDNPPDLILLDIMMPEIDGYEVCRRLKADERTRNIPVIFITAKTGEEDETKGLSLGAVDYITKPFSPAIVKARIKTHLEVKQHRDNLEELVRQRTEELIKVRDEEIQFLEMTTSLSFELNLVRLLAKIMDTTKELLAADRCTLFLFDEKKNELWSKVAQGLETSEIRFSSDIGIAGSVFTSGKTVNIPDAYNDNRFNPEVDKKTGYQTNSILCMPVKNKKGSIIGVTQVLNKKDGPFTDSDERRLRAFSAQASIALENAKLFEDVLNMKNYNESVLESMSNGMISLDAKKNIVKCNSASLRILRQNQEEQTTDSSARIHTIISKANPWILGKVDRVMETRRPDLSMDTDLILDDGSTVSINLTIVPLLNIQHELIGSLLVMEDITSEKRLKGTIARYMTQEVADRLMEEGEAVLGGRTQEATVMFSDIRSFTTISEKLGPQETVSLLNEYFTIMVDIIFNYKGTLDKYIGDAIMAVFGAPFSTGEDPDRAVKTAIDMLRALEQFNQQRKSHDHISIGIGINTDEVLSGNIGSMKRMDYTVIGDGVNLAARLEGANKVYGTNILMSEFTYRDLRSSYVCREVDMVRVKGRNEPVSVYQVLDYHDAASFPHRDDVLELFHKGLCCYRLREWRGGIEKFTRALGLNKNDPVSRLYLDRCRFFKENPPPDEWDGVWVMKTK
ncbi:adenylate/guanylate cyclase domain-containing protein [Desulfococcaceae bacterium HSG8]|nr:adenylate/guanylate cyclase domain-containing protein [Desulfococcaceae bacterium HSG8]